MHDCIYLLFSLAQDVHGIYTLCVCVCWGGGYLPALRPRMFMESTHCVCVCGGGGYPTALRPRMFMESTHCVCVCVCVGGGIYLLFGLAQHVHGIYTLCVCVCGGGVSTCSSALPSMFMVSTHCVCVCVGGGYLPALRPCPACSWYLHTVCVCVCGGGGIYLLFSLAQDVHGIYTLCVCVCVWGGGIYLLFSPACSWYLHIVCVCVCVWGGIYLLFSPACSWYIYIVCVCVWGGYLPALQPSMFMVSTHCVCVWGGGVSTCSSALPSMFMARMLTFLESLSLVSVSFWIRRPASAGLFAAKSYVELVLPKNWRSSRIHSYLSSNASTCHKGTRENQTLTRELSQDM